MNVAVCVLCPADWNGAGTRLVAGQAASEDTYWAFAEATRKLGVHAMLTKHRCATCSARAFLGCSFFTNGCLKRGHAALTASSKGLGGNTCGKLGNADVVLAVQTF